MKGFDVIKGFAKELMEVLVCLLVSAFWPVSFSETTFRSSLVSLTT